MARRLMVLVAMVSLIALTGCFFNQEKTVLYKSTEGGFEVQIPSDWKTSKLDSLLTGVQFTDEVQELPVKFWIIFSNESGRTSTEQVGDLQAILAFIVEQGATISNWEQGATHSVTVAASSGSEANVLFHLSGTPMKGIGVALTKEGKDFFLIGACHEELWTSTESTFDKVVKSFVALPK